MELEKSTMFVIIIMAIGLVLGIGLFILGQFQTSVFTNSTGGGSANQTVLSASTATLSPIVSGITSSTVKANNLTWINCTTSDSLVINISENKTTVSVWFTNNTREWTSLIKSGSNIYINGTLDAGWTWIPYFVSGNIITFCKTDGSTFINVSIDAIRVYEQELNSVEILEVYGYGR